MGSLGFLLGFVFLTFILGPPLSLFSPQRPWGSPPFSLFHLKQKCRDRQAPPWSGAKDAGSGSRRRGFERSCSVARAGLHVLICKRGRSTLPPQGCCGGAAWGSLGGGLGMWPSGTTPLRVDLAHCHLGHVSFDPPCPRFLICKAEVIVMPTLQFVL